jgi:hypothetical protein
MFCKEQKRSSSLCAWALMPPRTVRVLHYAPAIIKRDEPPPGCGEEKALLGSPPQPGSTE